ncbi:MAG: hypothetical protein Q9162_006017 [Coniocarpon cinnabarinum]
MASAAPAIRPSPPKSSPASAAERRSSKKDGESKMHKRSRSGCFTCRLRRKKCDEGRPVCRACKHLGVECEYKRPAWWQHPDRRKQHKEIIKEIIRNTKMEQKPSQQQQAAAQAHAAATTANTAAATSSMNTPPSLCHSLPTSETHSEMFPRTRAASTDSHFSPKFDIETPKDFFNSTPMMAPPQWTPMHSASGQFPYYSPFEVEIKTESHMFLNDVPTQTESVVSTFSTPHAQRAPPGSGSLPSGIFPPAQLEGWVEQELLDSHNEMIKEGEPPIDFNIFDFPHAPFSPSHQAVVDVDEGDRYLLDHFLEHVSRLVFPVMDVNQPGSARSRMMLPALESNKCYLECCLSTAALHLKACGEGNENTDNDIMRHRCTLISELCEAFNRETELSQTLEAMLGLIVFQAAVGSANDGLPDIPWHQHYHGAHDLASKLGLLSDSPDSFHNFHATQVPFNTTLTSWIDILGATVLGRVPSFADTYRGKLEAGISSGLEEVMGCDDRVMYLISEIACLESLKTLGQLKDDLQLCNHITALGEALTMTESGGLEVNQVYTPSGSIRPKQLSQNITAAFRVAARIHLCSLVPEFDRFQPSITALVDQLVDIWNYIPTGLDGFDRTLNWPLLVTGAVSIEGSRFRKVFAERSNAMGTAAHYGAFAHMTDILDEVWKVNDVKLPEGKRQSVHWRDVMQQKGWDYLLI